MAIATITNTTTIGKAFDKGLKIYKENFALVFLATLVAFLIGALTCGICMPVMMCGLSAVILTLVRGGATKPTVGDVFSKFNCFLPAFVSALVIAILMGVVSMILMLIPVLGLVLSYVVNAVIAPAVMSWVYLSIIDRNATIGEAIGAMKLPMEKPFWLFVLISFIAAVIGGIGAVACGIGVFFTIPLAYCIIVAAYNDMAGGEAK
jgi:hypothetical protein